MATSSGFAARTEVPVAKTRAEIEALLVKYGADQFAGGWDNEQAAAFLAFRITGRQVRMMLPIPQNAPDQEQRRRWRSQLLVLKAKLVAIADGITTIEREFMADVVLPNGQTVGQFYAPQIEEVYRTGQMPPLLPGLGQPQSGMPQIEGKRQVR